MKELTEKQDVVLRFIQNCIWFTGVSPTYREMCCALGISSTNGVADHVKALMQKGYIQKPEVSSPRGLLLTEKTQKGKHYSTISFSEIYAIMKAEGKSSKVLPVYLVLAGHDQKEHLKITDIREILGNTMTERSVYRALAWLKEHKIIEVNDSNVNRFTLIARNSYKLTNEYWATRDILQEQKREKRRAEVERRKEQVRLDKKKSGKPCVYQIKNTVNNKIYVGESFYGEHRFRQHLCDLRAKRHNNRELQDDFNKFGENVFEWSKIKECPEDKYILRLEERKVIQKFRNEKKSLYNIKQ